MKVAESQDSPSPPGFEVAHQFRYPGKLDLGWWQSHGRQVWCPGDWQGKQPAFNQASAQPAVTSVPQDQSTVSCEEEGGAMASWRSRLAEGLVLLVVMAVVARVISGLLWPLFGPLLALLALGVVYQLLFRRSK